VTGLSLSLQFEPRSRWVSICAPLECLT